jgi:putative transposase
MLGLIAHLVLVHNGLWVKSAADNERISNMSQNYNTLSHSKWDCKYHIIFIPKMRKKALYGEIRERLREVFHALAAQKDCKILQGYLMPDHVHMLIEIPPKYKVSEVVGFLKGKSAITIAREFSGKQRNSLCYLKGLEFGSIFYRLRHLAQRVYRQV